MHKSLLALLLLYCSCKLSKFKMADKMAAKWSFYHNLCIHCLHDFAHEQDSQLNSLVLITVWRVVIEVWQDSQLNSSAFSHCSVWRVAIGKGVLVQWIWLIFWENRSHRVKSTKFVTELDWSNYTDPYWKRNHLVAVLHELRSGHFQSFFSMNLSYYFKKYMFHQKCPQNCLLTVYLVKTRADT